MYYPQNNTMTRVIIFSGLLCYAMAGLAQNAGPTSKPVRHKPAQKIIDISAKSLLLDQDKGISEYRGNVLFKQDTLVIKADTITLFYKDKKLVKALVTGSPADVQQHPDHEARVHSQAEKMEYYVDENRLVLTGNAFVDQGSRHFSGQHIEYDTRQGTLTAGSQSESKEALNNSQNNQPNQRVHVIIGPAEEKKETTNE